MVRPHDNARLSAAETVVLSVSSVAQLSLPVRCSNPSRGVDERRNKGDFTEYEFVVGLEMYLAD